MFLFFDGSVEVRVSDPLDLGVDEGADCGEAVAEKAEIGGELSEHRHGVVVEVHNVGASKLKRNEGEVVLVARGYPTQIVRFWLFRFVSVWYCFPFFYLNKIRVS